MHVSTHASDALGACTFGSAGLPVIAAATCLAQSSSSFCCSSLTSAGGTGVPGSSGSTALSLTGLSTGNIARDNAFARASCVDLRCELKHGSSIWASCGALPETNLVTPHSSAMLKTPRPVGSVLVASSLPFVADARSFSMKANLMLTWGHMRSDFFSKVTAR